MWSLLWMKHIKATSRQPRHLYEVVNVQLNAVEHQEQQLDLKENVAYGPLKPTVTVIGEQH